MWKTKTKEPVLTFLVWTFLLVGVSYLISIVAEQTRLANTPGGGTMTTVIDTLLGSLSPMYGVYIVLKKNRLISGPKQFASLILEIKNKGLTVGVTAIFCTANLIVAILAGTRTEMQLYMYILAIPLMVLGGGLEEVGWRGFLQPALEKRFPVIIATLITAFIWFVWHLPLWLISSSNQASYSLLPYLLQLMVMAFVLAAIFRVTKSTIACVIYHACGNAVGAIYNWDMFASYPIHPALVVYDIVMIAVSMFILFKYRSNA